MPAGYYQQARRSASKKARERYQDISEERYARERYTKLSKEEKSKKQENGCKQYKSLPEHEKQKLGEYRKNQF